MCELERGYRSENCTPPESPVLEIEGLTIYAQEAKKKNLLINEVSLQIRPGETLGLVGESGSGKSVTASAVLGLMSNGLHIGGGQILFKGENILSWSEKQRRKLRGKDMGLVFQDYQGSFTPFLKVGKQLIEALRSHQKVSYQEAKEIVMQWLGRADLPSERVFNSYPFQLSGGQLQRAALAGAMMLKPALLIADEPTTALDVLTGEKVLDLLAELQGQTGCAILLITHDLRHVLKRADTIAVMKEGQIVEIDRAEKIRYSPQHSYTQMLLKARPFLSEIHDRMAQNEIDRKDSEDSCCAEGGVA
ncbi:MAG: ABC transporter ATP-binding protein [Thermotaleaceae bacterium]